MPWSHKASISIDICNVSAKPSQVTTVLKRLPHQAVFVSLMITGSMLFTLILIETILRLFPGLLAPEIRKAIQAIPENYGVSHPYIGHLHTPNNAFVLRGVDFTAVHHTDGHGFRNAWPWPDKAEIVALGDSVTFGQGVEDQQAWPAILARALPKSRVINLGLIGAGPQEYLRVYETFGLKLRPKLLLVGIFLRNDFWDADMFDRWLQSGWGGNYMVWRDFGRPEKLSFHLEEPIRSIRAILKWYRGLLSRSSYLYNLLLYVRGAARKWRPTEVVTFQLPDGARLELQPGNFERNTNESTPGSREFDLVFHALERIWLIARQNGTRVLIVFQPSKEETYLPLLGETVPDVSGPLRRELERLGVACLDLGPIFRERAAAGEKLFFEVDGHPNAQGYALIAEGTLSYLRENAKRYGLSIKPGSQN